MKVLYIFVSIVVAIKADYHDDVGIPLAERIKAYEEKMMANVPDMESRIVGGHAAALLAHPYLVGLKAELLGDHRSSVCGSSLVSATRLVTAAHCLDRTNSIEVVLGSQYLFYGGTRMKTKVFVAHPNFNRSNSYNGDIGVVSLPRPVEFSESIQPISLPSTPEEAEVVGEWATAAGYGLTNDLQLGVPRNSIVSEVRLKIIPENVCEKHYGSTIRGTWVCTSGEGGVGTCGGDSGGPLVVERKGRKILVGLTSFGSKLCQINLSSVFTRVATYLKFIQQHL